MSAQRPTRRELRNLLALADDGPYTLVLRRSMTSPLERAFDDMYWQVRCARTRGRPDWHVVSRHVNTPLEWWVDRFG